MEIQRFQEEVEIIEKEMLQIMLQYYTKKCIPGLYIANVENWKSRWEVMLLFNACSVPQVLKAIERIFLILVVYCSYTTVGLFKGP